LTDPATPQRAAADGPPLAARPRRARSLASQFAIPVLLAALGLVGALVGWRVAIAGEAAASESAAGVAATRAQGSAMILSEVAVARTMEAWLDYERSRRRAAALEAAGFPRTALREATRAASHYVLVVDDYLDPDGRFDPERMREARIAEAASREDHDAARHLALADAEHARVRQLTGAGIVLSGALPLLTLAEVTRGRLRRLSVVAGVGVFAAGLLLALAVWA
jgi:xanthosine utilization system XapX-like protein